MVGQRTRRATCGPQLYPVRLSKCRLCCLCLQAVAAGSASLAVLETGTFETVTPAILQHRWEQEHAHNVQLQLCLVLGSLRT
jgi:hypothetical protein